MSWSYRVVNAYERSHLNYEEITFLLVGNHINLMKDGETVQSSILLSIWNHLDL
jgi:hypothetical protein